MVIVKSGKVLFPGHSFTVDTSEYPLDFLKNVNSKENPWAWLYDFLKNHAVDPVQEMMRLIVEFNQNWIFLGKYDKQREEKGG